MNSVLFHGEVSLDAIVKKDPLEKCGPGQLKADVAKYRNVLVKMIEALTEFTQGDLSRFDAQVGDCSCQVRAGLFAQAARNPDLVRSLEKTIHSLNDVLKKIPSTADLNTLLLEKKKRLTKGQYTLKETLDHFHSAIKVNRVAEVICYAYAAGGNGGNEEFSIREGLMDVKLVKKNTDTKPFNDREIRKKLADYSVEYICGLRDIAEEEVKSFLCPSYEKSLSLKTLPAFAEMEAVLSMARQDNIPLVFKAKLIDPLSLKEASCLTRFFTAEGKDYVPQDPKETAIVLCAYAQAGGSAEKSISELISSQGVLTIVRSALAAHPQHPNEAAACEGYGDMQRDYYFKAHELGLCRENPALCRIYHIYADRVGKHINLEVNDAAD